jgi:hypothetical protein
VYQVFVLPIALCACSRVILLFCRVTDEMHSIMYICEQQKWRFLLLFNDALNNMTVALIIAWWINTEHSVQLELAEDSKNSENTCASAILSTTSPMFADLGSNPGSSEGKPVTNRLTYGMPLNKDCIVYCLLLIIAEILKLFTYSCLFSNYSIVCCISESLTLFLISV